MSSAVGVRLLLCVLLCWGCCAHGMFENGVYHNKEVIYRLGVPSSPGWRLAKPGKTEVLFVHSDTGAMLSAFSDCKEPRDIALRTLSQRMLIDFRDRRKLEQKDRILDGHAAVQTHWTAVFQGETVHLDTVVTAQRGCSYYLALLSTAPMRPQVLPDFERWVTGFAVPPVGETW